MCVEGLFKTGRIQESALVCLWTSDGDFGTDRLARLQEMLFQLPNGKRRSIKANTTSVFYNSSQFRRYGYTGWTYCFTSPLG